MYKMYLSLRRKK